MSTHNYESENELSFRLTMKEYGELLAKLNPITNLPILRAYKAEVIAQKWFLTTELPDSTTRSRIRKTSMPKSITGISAETAVRYEYTTKYYWKNGGRTEINSCITEKEFIEISSQYPEPLETKTRIYLEDTINGLHYTADIMKDNTVRLEIEFATQEAKERYVLPYWMPQK